MGRLDGVDGRWGLGRFPGGLSSGRDRGDGVCAGVCQSGRRPIERGPDAEGDPGAVLEAGAAAGWMVVAAEAAVPSAPAVVRTGWRVLRRVPGWPRPRVVPGWLRREEWELEK